MTTPQTKADDILERMKQYISEDFDPVASAICADAAREIRALRALAEKLPMTRDGVRIVPGMEVFVLDPKGLREARVIEVANGWFSTDDFDHYDGGIIESQGRPFDFVFSTRAAALAAAAAPPTAPNGGGVD